MKINYRSDFKTLEQCLNGDVATPFRFTYRTSSLSSYTVEFDGENYTSCRRTDDGGLLVIFDNHRLGTGRLLVQREYFLTDEDFSDNICHTVTFESLNIILTALDCDVDTPTVGVYPAYQKGDKGDKGTVELIYFEIIDGYLYANIPKDSNVEFSINENGELLASWH